MDTLDFNKISNHHPILFYDGVCVLCNRLINFLIRRDQKKVIRFIPLQSYHANQFLSAQGIDSKKLNTVVFLTKGKIFTKSSASIHAVSHLHGIWKIVKMGLILPPFIRNMFYDFIANRRYKWFGQSSQCIIPSDDVQERFLVDLKKIQASAITT